jgi:hypothetical protein
MTLRKTMADFKRYSEMGRNISIFNIYRVPFLLRLIYIFVQIKIPKGFLEAF